MEALSFKGNSRKERLRQKFEKAFTEEQAIILADEIVENYDQLVRVSDFSELKSIVKELAEAQKEMRGELKELAKAQKEMRGELKELAEAQKEMRGELKELAEAQKDFRKDLSELAKAQRKTEEELRDLVGEHKKTRQQIGGLSTTVGYRLEDEAYKALPALLKRDYGIIVEGRIKRQFIKDNKDMDIEVNIVGQGLKNGKKVTLIGEGKSQLSKNGVNEFIRKKLNRLKGIYEEIFPVLITYMISEPDVEEYAESKGIAIYYSYDFV